MNWPADKLCFALAVLCYGLSALYSLLLWRGGFRRRDLWNYALLALGAGWHTAAMFQRGLSLERCPVTNLYEAVSFIAWTIVAAVLVICAWPRRRFLGAFAAPLLFALGVFALMPALDVHHGPKPQFTGGAVSLHAALLLLAYGAFGLSSVAAVMYLAQNHDLKFNKLRAMLAVMPPIQSLEVTIERLALAGLLLLAGGLAVGGLGLTPKPGTSFWADSLVLWTLLVGGIYLALLVARWGFGQRGRRFALASVAGFAFVILTFWGVKLLSGIHSP